MHRLIEGYRMFRRTYFERHRGMFGLLAQGQAPKTMVISCCDSRVDPGLIFNTQPGEVFTLRNIANLVPPFSPDNHYHGTSAAIEFAVRTLEVEHVIVLGHARCGGVRALMGSHEGEFIGPWMNIAEAARQFVMATASDQSPEIQQRLCEHETLKISLANLRSFPWIRQRTLSGVLSLHGWYFDIEQGELQELDEVSGEFRSLL